MTQNRAGQRPPRYRPAGFFMIRAPLFPATAYSRLASARTTPETLLSLFERPLTGAALAAASAELCHRLQTDDGRAGLGDPANRLCRSMFRYMNRMTTRPTPFGLFAAVGTGLFEDSTSLRLGRAPLERAIFSPDMAWLEAVLQGAIDDSGHRGLVRLVANDSVFEAGGRLVHTPGSGDTGTATGTVSVRASALVREILRLTQRPVQADTLVTQLAARYRNADSQRIQSLIGELRRLDLLRVDLLPAPTERDPCGVAASQLPGTGSVAGQLAGIGRELGELGQLEPARLSPTRVLDLDRRQRALAPGYTGSTLQVDAALALSKRGLNHRVGSAVADAVTALASMADSADGSPHLRDYAGAFIERYGPGEEVPVLELLDPHTGLDAPRGYRWPAPAVPPRETAGSGQQWREQLLLGWIQEAIFDEDSIELTDDRIAALSQRSVPRSPPPLVDVYAQIHATSAEAIDRGDWLAVISPMGVVPGGRSFGRFHRLLPPGVTDRLRAFLDLEAELDPGPVFAELSYRPGETRMRNVNGHAHLRRYEIPVDIEPAVPDDRVLPLDDLLVGVDDGRFTIRSRRLRRTVVAVQSHMLSPVRAPNVCRFLLEVSADRYRPIWSFRDPVFGRLPYCPRIARGKIVLSPARWNLTRALLGWAGDDAGFAAAVGRWRARFRVPRHAYIINHDDDQRLLLDLEDSASLADLKRAALRLEDDPRSAWHYQGLREVLPDFDGLWLKDENGDARFCEVVVPLTLAHPVRHEDSLPGVATVPSAADRQVNPGGIWTQLSLYAAPDRHDQLIAETARYAEDLVSGGQVASWFFVRYADPMPHLRLRLRAAGTEVSAAVRESAVCWAQGLVELAAVREFTVGAYRREVGRYGGAAGLAECEKIFHGDSLGVSRVLAGPPGPDPADRVVVAAFTLDRLLSAAGFGDDEKMELRCLRRVPFRSDAAHRQRKSCLLGLMCAVRGGAPQPDSAVVDGAVVDGAGLDERYGAGARLCREPGAALASLPLARPWPSVADSLAHMHMNRMLGVDRQAEVEAGVLLRGCLLALRQAPSLAALNRIG
jgi:lantibiotic biosynthesis protein